MYQCRLTRSESALVIQPSEISDVKVIDTGDKERLYLEDSDPFPLTILDDSTITIQQGGILYTWRRADEIAKEWKKEICGIISDDLSDDHQGEFHSYVLSSKERRQENMIHWFICFSVVITIVVIIAIQAAIVYRREKRKLRFQLQQIQDMQENRPQVVRQAVERRTATERTGLAGHRSPTEACLSCLLQSVARPLSFVRIRISGMHAHQTAHCSYRYCQRHGSQHQHYQHHAQSPLYKGIRT